MKYKLVLTKHRNNPEISEENPYILFYSTSFYEAVKMLKESINYMRRYKMQARIQKEDGSYIDIGRALEMYA